MNQPLSPSTNQPAKRGKVARLSPLAAVAVVAALLAGCGSGSDESSAANATTVETVETVAAAATQTSDETGATSATAVAATETANTAAASAAAPGGGGPSGFGKNVDATSITTVDQLNALINEAYGQASLGLHRGHQPVEQVLIDTLGISHDEMHVRMDAGQNLSDIAEEQGVGTDTLINALVDNWQPAIDQLEAEGLITADQAAAYHQALVDAFTFKVTWNGSDEAPTFSGV